MGKRGFLQRISGRRRRSGDGEGIIDDLQDQAEWSSYTQDIPRLGNPRRERIRLQRYYRGFSGSGWFLAFLLVILGILALAVLGGVAYWLIEELS